MKTLKTNQVFKLTDFTDLSVARYGFINNKNIWFMKDTGGEVKSICSGTYLERVFYKKNKYENIISVFHNKRISNESAK